MISRVIRCFWVACALVCAIRAHAQSNVTERRYPIGERGSLVMMVPADWREQVKRRDEKTPFTVRYQQKTGAPFDVLVTPIWSMKAGDKVPTQEQLKRDVQSAADKLRPRAVETTIAANELLGVAAKGYYIKLTDRAPKKGEFTYLAQGMLGLGDVLILFTVLTNEGQQAVVDQAFSMLRSARIVGGPALAQAPTAAAPAVASAPLPPAQYLAKLSDFLQRQKFAELDAELARYQDGYRQGALREGAANWPLRNLPKSDPDLRVAYDKWVAEQPSSYAARVARARFLVHMAYLARGTAASGKTSDAQFEEMRKFLAAASEDLKIAQTLDQKPALVYATWISISQGVGDRPLADNAIAEAIRVDPGVLSARYAYLAVLQPQWGGSLEQMRRAVEAWRPNLTKEEADGLARVVVDAEWRVKLEPARVLTEQKKHQEAIAFLDKAIAEAPVLRAYAMRGYCYLELKEYAKAIPDFDRALEIDSSGGCCPNVLDNRAACYLATGEIQKGIADLERSALENESGWAAGKLAVISMTGRYGVKQDYDAMRRWCERAAKQGDPLSMYCMGGLYTSGVGGLPKDPKLAALWYQRAADRGVADAQADYAFMLWHGQGVASDHDKAIKYWRMAAKQGNKRAQTQLDANVTGWWERFTKITWPEWMDR
jgi:TPR repeat protein